MKAILTVGVSASGKSTWAEKMENEGWMTVCRDDIRFNLLNLPYSQRDWSKWNWKREKEVNAIVDKLIMESCVNGYNVIISDTNLNPKHRASLIKKLEDIGYTVELKEFPVTFEEAIRRDNLRRNGVGSSVIARQWEQWQDYLRSKGQWAYEEKPNHASVVICDIDGTLARMAARGAYDWERVGEDELNEYVADMLDIQEAKGVNIILVSGRDGSCRYETEKWLEHHQIPYNKLYMREAGDMRKDTVVKKEIFDTFIKDKYNVRVVIDDRPCVVRMWRDMGLNTMIVGNPWIEF